MPNAYGAPEISVKDVAARQQAGDDFVWLDVREPHEVETARIDSAAVSYLPLTVLAEKRLAALPAAAQDKNADIVVFCHHGVRSAQVVAWLRQQGWTQAVSMAGGIDAWAHEVDGRVGTY
jgi:adenylyltransferase/sulfurtransferase